MSMQLFQVLNLKKNQRIFLNNVVVSQCETFFKNIEIYSAKLINFYAFFRLRNDSSL